MMKHKEADDATIFVLAGCMLDVVVNMATRASDPGSDRRTARLIDSAVKVLRRDPEFIDRFQKQQQNVLKEFNRLWKR